MKFYLKESVSLSALKEGKLVTCATSNKVVGTEQITIGENTLEFQKSQIMLTSVSDDGRIISMLLSIYGPELLLEKSSHQYNSVEFVSAVECVFGLGSTSQTLPGYVFDLNEETGALSVGTSDGAVSMELEALDSSVVPAKIVHEELKATIIASALDLKEAVQNYGKAGLVIGGHTTDDVCALRYDGDKQLRVFSLCSKACYRIDIPVKATKVANEGAVLNAIIDRKVMSIISQLKGENISITMYDKSITLTDGSVRLEAPLVAGSASDELCDKFPTTYTAQLLLQSGQMRMCLKMLLEKETHSARFKDILPIALELKKDSKEVFAKIADGSVVKLPVAKGSVSTSEVVYLPAKQMIDIMGSVNFDMATFEIAGLGDGNLIKIRQCCMEKLESGETKTVWKSSAIWVPTISRKAGKKAFKTFAEAKTEGEEETKEDDAEVTA